MTSRMVRQNGCGVRGRLRISERADAGHAAYRAARPASGPRRDGARRPRRRAPTACPAHLARPAGRACRAGGLAGRPDLAGRIASQPGQCLADAGLAAASRTTPGQPGPGDRVAPGRIPARGTPGGGGCAGLPGPGRPRSARARRRRPAGGRGGAAVRAGLLARSAAGQRGRVRLRRRGRRPADRTALQRAGRPDRGRPGPRRGSEPGRRAARAALRRPAGRTSPGPAHACAVRRGPPGRGARGLPKGPRAAGRSARRRPLGSARAGVLAHPARRGGGARRSHGSRPPLRSNP